MKKTLIDNDNFQEIKKRSLGGIGSLLIRQVITKMIFLVANIALARLLVPQIFGVFAIVSFIVQFFSLFGEVGLGAALIQKKGSLEQSELSSIFWFQQAVAWCMAIIMFLAAPLVVTFYPSLPPVSVWLIRVIAVSLVVSSLKSVPFLQMERNLDFSRIAYIDIAESISFHTVAVVLAYAGFGVWSFVIAAICRSIASVAVVYSCSLWRPSFEFDFAAVRELLRFGLPYQGNNVLAFVKDALTPIFVGAYAGAAAVGYVNWARNLAFAPLMISESFGRVAFPAFSRLQDDKELLARTVERSIRMMTLIMFPVTAIMVALGPDIIRVVFTDKWMPGLWTFYFYCTSPFIIGFMLPMYSAILSVGKTDILLKMTAVLFLLEWGMGIPFVIRFGFNGISFSQPIIGLFFYFVYRRVLLKEGVSFSLLRNIRYQLIAALISGIAIKIVAMLININVPILAAVALIGVTLFAGIIYILNDTIWFEFKSYLVEVVKKGKDKI